MLGSGHMGFQKGDAGGEEETRTQGERGGRSGCSMDTDDN